VESLASKKERKIFNTKAQRHEGQERRAARALGIKRKIQA
jgi:DNA-binding NtrC family response regulator